MQGDLQATTAATEARSQQFAAEEKQKHEEKPCRAKLWMKSGVTSKKQGDAESENKVQTV